MHWIELPRQTHRRRNKMDNLVFSSRVRLTRNLEGLKFSSFLTDKDKYDIDERLAEILRDLSPQASILNFEDLPPEKRMIYLGSHILSEDFIKYGRKCAYDPDAEWVMLFNEQDHIRLFSLEMGYNLRKMYQRLTEILENMEKKVDFAYDEQLGYLTSSVLNVGTGLRFSVLLNLYGLLASKEIDQLIETARQMGYNLSHYGTENKDSGLFVLSNLYSLGMREEDMLHEFENFLESLYDTEMQSRSDFFRDKDELELAFEELMDINTLQEMPWDLLLYYVSLIDALHRNYLSLSEPVDLKRLVFQATDTEIKYRHGVEEKEVNRYRMEMLRRVTVQIRYKVLN